jgi:hypothetical protein
MSSVLLMMYRVLTFREGQLLAKRSRSLYQPYNLRNPKVKLIVIGTDRHADLIS